MGVLILSKDAKAELISLLQTSGNEELVQAAKALEQPFFFNLFTRAECVYKVRMSLQKLRNKQFERDRALMYVKELCTDENLVDIYLSDEPALEALKGWHRYHEKQS